jgi:hypothetical protein
LEKQLRFSKLKLLDLLGHNPIQRCLRCAGRDWDKHLLVIGISTCITFGAGIFQAIAAAEQKSLKRIVLHRSLITIPPENREMSTGKFN